MNSSELLDGVHISEFREGRTFLCKMDMKWIVGVIHIESIEEAGSRGYTPYYRCDDASDIRKGPWIYLLQNKTPGFICRNMKGFDYSHVLGSTSKFFIPDIERIKRFVFIDHIYEVVLP